MNAERTRRTARRRATFAIVLAIASTIACSRKTTITQDLAPGPPPVPPLDVLPADTTIVLARSRCFGDCPAYAVTIRADGHVAFEGRGYSYGPPEGKPPMVDAGDGTLDPKALLGLVNRIRAARFFELKDDYPTHWTDMRSCIVTITLGGQTKSIRDAGGPDHEVTFSHDGEAVHLPADVPPALREVEDDIDRVAETKRWLEPN